MNTPFKFDHFNCKIYHRFHKAFNHRFKTDELLYLCFDSMGGEAYLH